MAFPRQEDLCRDSLRRVLFLISLFLAGGEFCQSLVAASVSAMMCASGAGLAPGAGYCSVLSTVRVAYRRILIQRSPLLPGIVFLLLL